jgi:hypothetical protein
MGQMSYVGGYEAVGTLLGKDTWGFGAWWVPALAPIIVASLLRMPLLVCNDARKVAVAKRVLVETSKSAKSVPNRLRLDEDVAVWPRYLPLLNA